MNAIAFPSGDQRGTAICKPCNGPLTTAGARIALGAAASCCVYSFATHQLFSPGGLAAIEARPFESGAQSNSYTCNLAGVTCVGATGAAASTWATATR